MDDMEGRGSAAGKSTRSKRASQAGFSQKSQQRSSAAGSGGSEKLELKFDIDKLAKLQLHKGTKIEKLDDDFLLAAHPFPQMEGEMILF